MSWRIINNRSEKILNEVFETEEEAKYIMEKLIEIRFRKQNPYDMDVAFLDNDNMTYAEYIDTIEDC